jgi:hypothetical protein
MLAVHWTIFAWGALAGVGLQVLLGFLRVQRVGWPFILLPVLIALAVDRMTTRHKFWHGILAGVGVAVGYGGMSALWKSAVPEQRGLVAETIQGTLALAALGGLLTGLLTVLVSRGDARTRATKS